MNQICFINGSPRGNNSASKKLMNKVRDMLDNQMSSIHEICVVESLKNNAAEKDFALLEKMNSIVFVFPLYIDAIPSNLLEYMYEFDEYVTNHVHTSDYTPPAVYAIINNGFIEGSQNINALQIMAHYTSHIGYDWRFGIGIGGGEFIRETMEVIPLNSKLKHNIYDAFLKLAAELEAHDKAQSNNIMTNPSIPKFLFKIVGNRHWISEAKASRESLSKKIWHDI